MKRSAVSDEPKFNRLAAYWAATPIANDVFRLIHESDDLYHCEND